MYVNAAELILITGVSGFQILKLVFCMSNKLHFHAEIKLVRKYIIRHFSLDPTLLTSNRQVMASVKSIARNGKYHNTLCLSTNFE